MNGKGDKRRRENTAAVRANWPFPEIPKPVVLPCPSCYAPMCEVAVNCTNQPSELYHACHEGCPPIRVNQ
jgi:hypothetical protein